MPSVNVSAYCWEDLGPDKIKMETIVDVRESGVRTVNLFALHIGDPDPRPPHPILKYGDLVFNNSEDLLVRDGKFNIGSMPIASWPSKIVLLKEGGICVSNIFFTIGGGGVKDFRNITYMLDHGMADQLKANFVALRRAFTLTKFCVIDGFDIDYEEDWPGAPKREFIDREHMVAFCGMLFDLGFKVTFCPYEKRSFWKHCMQDLWKQGKKVSAWNLQCYAGGDGNLRPAERDLWIAALNEVVTPESGASYLAPGLPVRDYYGEQSGQCPTGDGSFYTTFKDVRNLGLGGGWLWRYDDIAKGTGKCPSSVSLAAYVKAISDGLDH